jgi:ABC-type nitrate/sulfonate/bicarbonate transport system substrate-binding protein
MSFFKFDEENASAGFELVAEGKYEAVIVNAEPGKTQAGKPKLSVDFEIRSDVPQNHQGAKVLYNTFTFEHEVSVRIVNSLLKACGFANNHAFSSPEDMAKQLINKNLKITVKHEEYEKMVDGEKQKRTAAKAKYYDVSDVTPVMQSGGITINDDDIPF